MIMTTLPPYSRDWARSAAMQEAGRRLRQAIEASGGVLVHGEPGSGREWFARAIHHGADDRAAGIKELLRRAIRQAATSRPFVVVDCASHGFEEQLFGTAAPGDRAIDADPIAPESAVHLAIGGTLVLRNVTEMPARAQVRLARLLRDGEAAVTGEGADTAPVSLNVRPIAIMDAGSTDRIVPDLQRRLAETTIEVPPLRHRRDDIPALARYLLKELCAAQGVPAKVASAQALELLAALPWKGNVRELEAVLTAVLAKTPARMVRLVDVLANVRLDDTTAASSCSYAGTLREARAKFERDYVSAVLERHHGRMAEAARALGIQRTNLYRKVRQLSVTRRRPGQRASSSDA
jgi:DNA-binding NtrC family response regulator